MASALPRPLRLHTRASACARLERPQRLGRLAAERADEGAVVVVRHLAGAVVELELLQRPERPVAHLGQLQLPLLELAAVVQRVPLGRRLAQVGQRDEDDARRGEQRAEDERDAS